jgi:hypothetical protein
VHRIGASIAIGFLFVAVCSAQDLSSYRGFQLGSTAEAVAKTIGSVPSRLTVIYTEPALIEEFEWNPRRTADAAGTADSLRNVRFSFFNHELFRMVVTYDPNRTEGLTTEDVIEAIGKEYGKPSTSDAMVIVSSLGTRFPSYERTLAAWDTAKQSYRLFRSSFGSTFGLVIVSKELEALATAASEESIAQEQLDAPRKELERRAQQDNERSEAQAKARSTNKPKFRP